VSLGFNRSLFYYSLLQILGHFPNAVIHGCYLNTLIVCVIAASQNAPRLLLMVGPEFCTTSGKSCPISIVSSNQFSSTEEQPDSFRGTFFSPWRPCFISS
jgi:hypothetical protein